MKKMGSLAIPQLWFHDNDCLNYNYKTNAAIEDKIIHTLYVAAAKPYL